MANQEPINAVPEEVTVIDESDKENIRTEAVGETQQGGAANAEVQQQAQNAAAAPVQRIRLPLREKNIWVSSLSQMGHSLLLLLRLFSFPQRLCFDFR